MPNQRLIVNCFDITLYDCKQNKKAPANYGKKSNYLERKVVNLEDSMVKYIEGLELLENIETCFVCAKRFPGAKVRCNERLPQAFNQGESNLLYFYSTY